MKNLREDYEKVVETLVKDPKSYDDTWSSEKSEDFEDFKNLFNNVDRSWE